MLLVLIKGELALTSAVVTDEGQLALAHPSRLSNCAFGLLRGGSG